MKKFLLILLCIPLFLQINAQQIVDATDWRIFESDKHQTEVHISINKKSPNIILVSANIHDNKKLKSQGYYYSLDEGITWQGADEIPNNVKVFGDPVTGFDANGDFHLVSMAKKGDDSDGYYVFSSTDNGANWTHMRGTGPDANLDKPMSVFFDDHLGSPFSNNFYCAWTQWDDDFLVAEGVRFNRSTNLLQNFDNAFWLTPDYGQGTNVQVGPNGEVYVCWANYTNGGVPAQDLGFAYSNMGGAVNSFTVGLPFSYSGIRTSTGGITQFGGPRTNDFPSMAVDRSCGPHRGRIYVAYPEFDSQGNAVIDLQYSDDHGAVGSFINPPNPISTPNVEQAFFPWVACDPVTGIIVVAYHGLNDASPFNETNTYVAYSNDGGVTFNNIKVSDVSHHRAEVGEIPIYAGDYLGIDIYNGIAYAGWADPRVEGNIWQVYVSKLDLSSIANKVISISGDMEFTDHTFNDHNVTYKANNILVSGVSQVTSSAIVRLVGNNSVDLPPDFDIHIGADFQAFIDPFVCQTPGYTTSRQANNIALDDHNTETDHDVENNFVLYPNPASNNITVKTTFSNIALVSVFDLFGSTIYEKNLSEGKKEASIDVRNLSPGPYFIQITTVLGEMYTKKFLVQK